MTLKIGTIVSHSGMLAWGSGKVLEITPTLANIQFSDGKSRKIAASHFSILEPADRSSYTPPPEMPIDAKPVKSPRTVKKKKVVALPA